MEGNASNIDCCTMEGQHIPPQFRHPHCFPIDVLPQDPFYGPRGVRCLNFVRSMVSPRADCRIGYADQVPYPFYSFYFKNIKSCFYYHCVVLLFIHSYVTCLVEKYLVTYFIIFSIKNYEYE